MRPPLSYNRIDLFHDYVVIIPIIPINIVVFGKRNYSSHIIMSIHSFTVYYSTPRSYMETLRKDHRTKYPGKTWKKLFYLFGTPIYDQFFVIPRPSKYPNKIVICTKTLGYN